MKVSFVLALVSLVCVSGCVTNRRTRSENLELNEFRQHGDGNSNTRTREGNNSSSSNNNPNVTNSSRTKGIPTLYTEIVPDHASLDTGIAPMTTHVIPDHLSPTTTTKASDVSRLVITRGFLHPIQSTTTNESIVMESDETTMTTSSDFQNIEITTPESDFTSMTTTGSEFTVSEFTTNEINSITGSEFTTNKITTIGAESTTNEIAIATTGFEFTTTGITTTRLDFTENKNNITTRSDTSYRIHPTNQNEVTTTDTNLAKNKIGYDLFMTTSSDVTTTKGPDSITNGINNTEKQSTKAALPSFNQDSITSDNVTTADDPSRSVLDRQQSEISKSSTQVSTSVSYLNSSEISASVSYKSSDLIEVSTSVPYSVLDKYQQAISSTPATSKMSELRRRLRKKKPKTPSSTVPNVLT